MQEIEKRNKELLEEVEKLKRQNKILKEKKHYGIVWEEEKEPEQIVLDCQYKIPILKEVKTKKIIADKEKPQNILIEGDNYHALSVLNYTHKKKIDVIYIDPPYNTGAKDWKYNNNYVDINDLYRHSKWLSMMSKRLWLAKNLLKEDGVLICTIDENEVNHLGVLLEEIFKGYEIHSITIVHNPRGVQGNNFSYTHEYAYFIFRNGLKVIGSKQRDEILEEELRDHGGESLRTDARNCFYPILVKNNKIIGFGKVLPKDFHPKYKNVKLKNNITEVWPIDVKGIERKWVFARQTIEEIKDKLFVGDKKNGEIDIFRRKDTQKPRTVWTGPRYDASTFGSKIVNELTNTSFPFPKSLFNVRDCLECVVKQRKNAIVLDYFAGSGTTGHAVMILNKEDNGNRKFILCTNNENNIAVEVCYPRIKKVIEGHKAWPDITKIPANLRYFKTELLDIDHISHVSDEQKIKLTYQAGEMIALRENTFEEVEKNEWWQIFKDRTKYTAIYFKEDKSKLKELIKKLGKLKENVTLYIFSWGKNEYNNEFTDYKNIKVEDIPEPIIEVYKEVNRLG
ncbi:site-specific DNA-methyltransferase [bacterium]|nr:site-specific DNA-methyltransferase [bacterium]